jgi:hypothetical protein
MPGESNHPVFKAPNNPNIKVWRYMDFSKYVSLLDSGALYFSRADMLGDPYEGATSHINRVMWPMVYEGKIPIPTLEGVSSYHEFERQWTLINCWHMNDHESDAMWKLYARTCDAVAIQSTYIRLHNELPAGTFVGVVEYMDYGTEWMREDNSLHRYMRKRESFEHERELRALIQHLPSAPEPRGSAAQILIRQPNPERGRFIPVRLPELLEKVYVAPTAPVWFRELVLHITAKYGLNLPVEQSSLHRPPVF